jgi:Ni/Fe-hydrogenase subunit HybB-like protein
VKSRRLLLGILALLIALGGFAAVQQVRHGDAVTSLGTLGAGGVVWGLYVAGDSLFAGVGLAGLILAALLRASRARHLEPAAHRAVALAIACLLASALCVLADLGRASAALIDLPLVGRARAPFFATFTLVAGASLFAAVVQWFLASRPGWAERARAGGRLWRILACGPQASPSAAYRRSQVNLWFGPTLLPLLLLALAILARVFSARTGRPTALIHLETAAFMISAAAAACSLVLLTSPQAARRALARILSVLLVLSVLCSELCEILALRSPGLAIQGYAQALLHGPWKPLFWGEMAFFLVAGFLVPARLWRGLASTRWLAIVAGLVCVAVFIQRYLLLVAWQTHGLSLSWPTGHYQPTWVEWGLLLGIAALAASLMWLLMSLGDSHSLVRERAGHRQAGRLLLTAVCVLLGGALALVGLALSAGVGSGAYLDPVVTGGPLIFLGGLVLMLMAPALYELLPESPIKAKSESMRTKEAASG